MRKVINPQRKLGEQDIGAIFLDPKSRDDIPHILRGLQHIYLTADLRERVFSILQEVIGKGVQGKASASTGRPGMDQWTILVLGVLRHGLNADYDRVCELANQHNTLRQMLGHSDWEDQTYYELQTIKDNLRLFIPDILDRINQEVVRAGHALVKKTKTKRCRLVVTRLWSKPTCIFQPTSTCCTTPPENPSRPARICAMPMDRMDGAKAREGDPVFRQRRRAHSAVESAINSLEVHGLDRCPDHGIDGFKRYVALAVVVRNIHHLGALPRNQEKEREKQKRGPYRKAA